ncbi:MAG: branched-chain amino acid aminotransferase [Dehalococcoidia bacterium]|nr:branched-chain amino acid aminotransferase [Dehalococcoidia bacterium]
MSEFIAYLNGEWVPRSELKVHVDDRGFRVGDTVFDVTRTFNGTSFLLDRHMDRLYRSMKYVRIDIGISIKEMTRLTEEAVEKNLGFIEEHGDFDIWHAITRGPGRWAYEANAPTVIIDVAPIPWDWFGSDLNGAKGVITKTRSMSSQTVDPKIKHHSRLNFNLAEMEAGDIEDHGWPVLTDGSGNLTEGVGYNLFTVTNGVIRTPNDTSILQGVSRGYVLELAEQLGMQVIEEDLQPYDLYTADEAFFSSTPYCLLPVTAFDKRDIGDGKPGPVFKQLMSAWSERVGVDVVGQAEKHYQKML